MRDKYDEAIEYLTANPDQIYVAWVDTTLHPHGCLFQFAGHGSCITMIRNGWDGDSRIPELTRVIRNDERLPSFARDIKPAHLPVFADYQRKLDIALYPR